MRRILIAFLFLSFIISNLHKIELVIILYTDEEFIKYAAIDSCATYKLWLEMQETIHPEKYDENHPMYLPF